jgi:hypothetical protein
MSLEIVKNNLRKTIEGNNSDPIVIAQLKRKLLSLEKKTINK